MVRGECVLPEHKSCDKEDCRYWLPMERYQCVECGLKQMCEDYKKVDESKQLELDLFADLDENNNNNNN